MDDGELSFPKADAAARAGLPAAPSDPLATLDAAAWGHLVQDYRPLCESLEWRLSRRVWVREGARPFIEGGVPNQINNSGTLSADAAALLMEAWRERPSAGPIRILEVGAGLGLFARLLLDELARLCAEQQRDEYARIEYWVTDASPTAVEHWRQVGLFDTHADKVVSRECPADALAELHPGPWQAVFANYVLDVLPARVLRYGDGGWEQLQARCWIRTDAATLRAYTTLSPDELRMCAEIGDEESLDALLPLVPLLESEIAFAPIDDPSLPAGVEPDREGRCFTVNVGAQRCLDVLLPRLAPGGLCLVSDYAAEQGSDAQAANSQRFGPVTSIGLNLPALELQVSRAGFEVSVPEGDGEHPLQHRLIAHAGMPETRAAFGRIFSTPARMWRDEPLEFARQQVALGQWARALPAYREALARAPGDWALLVEVAAFAGTELRDATLAVELARAALHRNPWTDPRGWCVLGEALAAQGNADGARECFEQALRIHPRDPASWLGLARSQLALARPDAVLQAVAGGLASDRDSMFRHLLLAEQARALDALAMTWGAERAAAARRNG